MSSRTVQTLLFAAVILAAHMHCIVLHAWDARAAVLAQLEEVPPPPSSPTCENESGCICKGATLAVMVDSPVVDLPTIDVMPILSPSRLDVTPTVAAADSDAADLWRASLSAGTVRALLQSYRL
jgi:hypothetical protein